MFEQYGGGRGGATLLVKNSKPLLRQLGQKPVDWSDVAAIQAVKLEQQGKST